MRSHVPVSRSRKSKKQKSAARGSGNPANRLPVQRSHSGGAEVPTRALASGNPFGRVSALSVLAGALGGPREEPDWVADAASELLDGARVLLDAQSPRALEDLTARLFGEHLHRMAQEHDEVGVDWLLEEVLTQALTRLRNEPSAPTTLLLLHGLRTIAGPALAHAAEGIIKQQRRSARADAAAGTEPAVAPDWLTGTGRLRMTGEVWTIRDVYGARIGVIAATEYPGGLDRAVYLFDVDACAFITIAGGGSFDDLDQAVAAWRTAVGWAADSAPPVPLAGTGTEVLRCLREADLSEDLIRGDEPRAVWNEWLRSMRRVHDLTAALNRTGRSLPGELSLYRDYDSQPLTAQFTVHLTQLRDRPLTPVEQDAVAALVGEWLDGMLPDTYLAVSPHRLQHQVELINDWIEDEVTTTVKALLPDWVAFLAHSANLPKTAGDAALTALRSIQAGNARDGADCPGLG